MTDEPTCGKGLAEHSALPAKVAELARSMAGVLEVHQSSLDLDDANAKTEHEAYVALTNHFRDVAGTLTEIAARMAGYRDLPMGAHDEAALAGPRSLDSFAAYVRAERNLLALLQTWVERDEAMLGEMGGGA